MSVVNVGSGVLYAMRGQYGLPIFTSHLQIKTGYNSSYGYSKAIGTMFSHENEIDIGGNETHILGHQYSETIIKLKIF